MEFEGGVSEEGVVGGGGEFVGDGDGGEDGGFVGPAAGDVFDCVAASAEDEEWDPEPTDVVYALSVAFDTQIERAEPVAP